MRVRVGALLARRRCDIAANKRRKRCQFTPSAARRAAYSRCVNRLRLLERSRRPRDRLRLGLAWLVLAAASLALIAAAGPALADPAPTHAEQTAQTTQTAPATPAAQPAKATATANPASAGEAATALGAAIAKQAREFAQQTGARPGLRVEVEVGTLDARLRLAPCDRIEPYVPNGTRLWGRTRIGLRCTQGATRWNVYLPLTVKVFGPGVTSTAALPAGTQLSAADLQPAEVDLATRGAPVTDLQDAVGRTLARPVAAGQPLRATDLRRRQWFAAGERVQITAVGTGFRVNGEGQALGPGYEGQAARVRTESGRVVVGQPVAERRIEIAM